MRIRRSHFTLVFFIWICSESRSSSQIRRPIKSTRSQNVQVASFLGGVGEREVGEGQTRAHRPRKHIVLTGTLLRRTYMSSSPSPT